MPCKQTYRDSDRTFLSHAKNQRSRTRQLFRTYFEMTYDPDDRLAELGDTLQRTTLAWPRSKAPLESLAGLQVSMQRR